MRYLRESVVAQLRFFAAIFAVIVVTLAGAATVGYQFVDQKTEEITGKWLHGTVLLGEMLDRIGEYRLAETYRSLAADPAARGEAELTAAKHGVVIQQLLNEYVKLIGDRTLTVAVDDVRHAWKAYQAGHDEWVKSDTADGAGNAAARENALRPLYKTTDEAVDRLVEANVSAAYEAREALHLLLAALSVMGLVVSAATIVLAIWILSHARSTITRPLGAITTALSELAAGRRDVQVPELNRSDEIGQMANAFEVFRANSVALERAHEEARRAQIEAHELARHDVLTGLPNRRVFSAELRAALARAENTDVTFTVMLIDLDRFKEINDVQGHAVGDVLLCEVARRLKEVAGPTDMVARLGGDEFAVIAEGEAELHAHIEGARHLANKFLGVIREPVLVDGTRASVGASIGITTCRGHENDGARLLHQADVAMYRAKRDGSGTFRFFEQSMDEEIRARAALEAELRIAVAEERIKPWYQPLVDIRGDHVCGFEALARWEHPVFGFVSPDVFIPMIEQLGLMANFTSSILRLACEDAQRWGEDIRLSMNVSPTDLKDPLLPTRILGILAGAGFAPGRLDVEITETALVGDIATAKSILTTLRGFGIKICLDDFGTGYSSLYHLRELKFDKVKIDQSFVRAMLVNSESEKIVDAILGLAKNLNLSTVAEGIENAAALRHLSSRGCEFGQGYYFGKAMTADDAMALLSAPATPRKAA